MKPTASSGLPLLRWPKEGEGARRILMVCMGNICRSPTAEAVLRHRIHRVGLQGRVEVDSAGTHAWHSQDPPDERSIAHAARRGYDLSTLRARRVREEDFERFHLILAMDRDNLVHLSGLCPEPFQDRLHLLMDFAPELPERIVPDPYYGSAVGFERVLDLVECACDGLARYLHAAAGPR